MRLTQRERTLNERDCFTATQHALDRWNERYPGGDIRAEYDRAYRPTKGVKRQIKSQCPKTFRKTRTQYYLITRAGIVFVMDQPETVITVFPLDGSDRYIRYGEPLVERVVTDA